MTKHTLRTLGITLVALSIGAGGLFTAQVKAAANPLVISEIQTGGLTANQTEDGRQEFIELHNTGLGTLSVDGWRVEYLSAGHDGTGEPTRVLAELSGEIAADGYVLLSYDGYLQPADLTFGAGSNAAYGLLARGGGHVRIVDDTKATLDLVGWGSGAQIGDWWQAPEIPAGKSIQRLAADNPAYVQGTIFAEPADSPTPQGGGLTMPKQQPACSGLMLSEILPNATGSDTGQEFIELHNPTTNTISLLGCQLRLDNGAPFDLPDELLAAGGYRAFYDSETGLSLPNKTAAAVWLLQTDSEASAQYQNDMPDDVSWAYMEDSWQPTYKPTPSDTNELVQAPAATDGGSGGGKYAACAAGQERNPATNRCRKITEPSAYTPCDPGETRNPDTHRCRSASSSSTGRLTPCKAGQIRNPSTNRCRAVTTAATTLKTCQPGQTRNPATNRCKAVAGASTTLKPCVPGQERNPQTNRCRKSDSAAHNSAVAVQDVATNPVRDPRWWLAGVAVVAAIGYAGYEWRHELAKKFKKPPTSGAPHN